MYFTNLFISRLINKNNYIYYMLEYWNYETKPFVYVLLKALDLDKAANNSSLLSSSP